MRSSLFFAFLVLAVFAGVAATGNSAHADPPAEARALARIGVDGVAGTGLFELVGGSLRAEKPVSRSGALLARAGHLQVRWFENETKELYPLYIAQAGYRHYGEWAYASIEGGVVMSEDYRGWHAATSGAVTLGAKLRSVDLGLSLMKIAMGASLGVHLGIDFASW